MPENYSRISGHIIRIELPEWTTYLETNIRMNCILNVFICMFVLGRAHRETDTVSDNDLQILSAAVKAR